MHSHSCYRSVLHMAALKLINSKWSFKVNLIDMAGACVQQHVILLLFLLLKALSQQNKWNSIKLLSHWFKSKLVIASSSCLQITSASNFKKHLLRDKLAKKCGWFQNMFTQLKNVSVSAWWIFIKAANHFTFLHIEIIKSPNDEILQTSDLLGLLWRNAV